MILLDKFFQIGSNKALNKDFIMTSWITLTPRLREGLDIIDRIDSGKLRLLASRICQSLQTSVEGNVFSPSQEEKLSVSLGLNKTELSLLLDTTTLIYAQAAYYVVKPALMESDMKETFAIQNEKADVLVQIWATYAKSIVDELLQKSIFPVQVTEINWNLNVQSSSTVMAKDMRSTVMLQVGLNDTSSKQSKSSITIETDKTGLLELYNNLEKIQSQLDSLK
ncbi:COMM domain-containing protein 10 [Diprion similis]|uniref:COMM domain-containing protein 10 n=1 Tax=Diprion similis TaxID=362088 RepID=UPI001EF93202|nr:COMM domain-containing protein 10 [Diprion similis]